MVCVEAEPFTVWIFVVVRTAPFAMVFCVVEVTWACAVPASPSVKHTRPMVISFFM